MVKFLVNTFKFAQVSLDDQLRGVEKGVVVGGGLIRKLPS